MSKVHDIRKPKPVQIELGGKLRTLQFDMNAYAELEERYGSIEKAMNQLQGGKMKDVRNILWVGLIHEEAIIDEETGEPIKYNITPYQVGQMISNTGLLKLASEKLSEAMSQGMTEEELQEADQTSETKNA